MGVGLTMEGIWNNYFSFITTIHAGWTNTKQTPQNITFLTEAYAWIRMLFDIF